MPINNNTNNNGLIRIKGAKVHNLKNISLEIPRNKFVVITGLSGSGKSSLAFDTLYAEGQRRYVESLSSYARQFLGRISKPEVDLISGLPPAIAIEQKVNIRNPRSTVGTSTEIYDYIKLLYARIGKTISPISKTQVKRHNINDVVNFIFSQPENSVVFILTPFILPEGRNVNQHLEILLQQGYSRIFYNNEIFKISSVLSENKNLDLSKIEILIDRIEVTKSDDILSRIADSAQTAFYEGRGTCSVKIENKNITEIFSNKFELDGITFEEPSEYMFSFNNPVGACPKCEGFGLTIGIDPDLVIPNKNLSIYEEAIVCWKGDKMKEWKDEKWLGILNNYFLAYYELTKDQKQLIWDGNNYFKGLHHFFAFLEENSYKIQYRVMSSRYRGKTICPECNGSRLKKTASFVKINNTSIQELVGLPINELKLFFKNLELNEYELSIGKRLLIEINNRIDFLINVGLGYLTLNRTSASLSGGESQRINIATSLGSSLVGSLYILDEPSIGLHPRDTEMLIDVLKHLRNIGNSVIVVEHDEGIMKAADMIIDIGPKAGRHGGEVVFQGNHSELLNSTQSCTARFLTGIEKIEVPKIRRKWNSYIQIVGARENNLKNITVKIPLNIFTVITGVSGSGKSTLIKRILYPALKKLKGGFGEKTGEHDNITGDIHTIHEIEFVDQNPIGKSSRSNPITYLKAFDDIRTLFSKQKAAQYNGYKPSHFSFNVDGGRCEECQGEGIIKVEMQFMADVHLLCDSCKGKRFKDEILDVKYKSKSIFDILEMTIDEAIEFFTEHGQDKITAKIQPLADVGLGYVKLGQSSSTLSGGESQRVKLASFLNKDTKTTHLFIFDEPTTGLHFHDIRKLLEAFNALIKAGHSILVIEHNLDVIKTADWIIDLGQEGGDKGGHIVFEGSPEEIIKEKNSYTGKFLAEKI